MGLLNYLYKKAFGSNKVERRYGWKKGDKYTKHCKMLLPIVNYHSNIKLVDLRDKCPDVYDQGNLGSCTANSLAFCYHFDELLQKGIHLPDINEYGVGFIFFTISFIKAG